MSTSLEEWLELCGCEQFAQLLHGNGFHSANSLYQVPPSHLLALGVPYDVTARIYDMASRGTSQTKSFNAQHMNGNYPSYYSQDQPIPFGQYYAPPSVAFTPCPTQPASQRTDFGYSTSPYAQQYHTQQNQAASYATQAASFVQANSMGASPQQIADSIYHMTAQSYPGMNQHHPMANAYPPVPPPAHSISARTSRNIHSPANQTQSLSVRTNNKMHSPVGSMQSATLSPAGSTHSANDRPMLSPCAQGHAFNYQQVMHSPSYVSPSQHVLPTKDSVNPAVERLALISRPKQNQDVFKHGPAKPASKKNHTQQSKSERKKPHSQTKDITSSKEANGTKEVAHGKEAILSKEVTSNKELTPNKEVAFSNESLPNKDNTQNIGVLQSNEVAAVIDLNSSQEMSACKDAANNGTEPRNASPVTALVPPPLELKPDVEKGSPNKPESGKAVKSLPLDEAQSIPTDVKGIAALPLKSNIQPSNPPKSPLGTSLSSAMQSDKADKVVSPKVSESPAVCSETVPNSRRPNNIKVQMGSPEAGNETALEETPDNDKEGIFTYKHKHHRNKISEGHHVTVSQKSDNLTNIVKSDESRLPPRKRKQHMEDEDTHSAYLDNSKPPKKRGRPSKEMIRQREAAKLDQPPSPVSSGDAVMSGQLQKCQLDNKPAPVAVGEEKAVDHCAVLSAPRKKPKASVAEMQKTLMKIAQSAHIGLSADTTVPGKRKRGRPVGSVKNRSLDSNGRPQAMNSNSSNSSIEHGIKEDTTLHSSNNGPVILPKPDPQPLRSPKLSTHLSPSKHNSESVDVSLPTIHSPWLCVFCHQISNYKNLGDLHGGYAITAGTPLDARATSGKRSEYNKRRGDHEACETHGATPTEVWFHEKCIVWAPGVYLSEGKLYGVYEAVTLALTTICSICRINGAMIGCFTKGCSRRYHVHCAHVAGCAMLEDNFSVVCPKHKKKEVD